KEPRTDGFWVEELEVPQSQRGLSLTEQVLDGRVYLVAPLMRKALFGLKPGKYTITPLEADIAKVNFFGTPLRSEHLQAEPVDIEIVPLPAGAPAAFDSSAVGTFTLTAEVDRDHVQVGDAITLKLRLEGQGNLRKIALPTLPRPPGWKLYEPKVDVALRRNTEVSGSKTAEYLLLPEQPGTTEIPALQLSYFDTSKTDYVTLQTQPIRLQVTGQAAAPAAPLAAAPAAAAAGSENLLAIDVRPLRNRPTLRRDLGTVLYRSPLFLSLVIAPPALLGLLSLAAAARARLGQETEGRRRRKLQRLASRRLRTATALLREGRLAPSLAEIERVLREVLASKLGPTTAGMSRDELRTALASAGAEVALVDATVAALDDCDRARFAPGSITAEEARVAIGRAGEIIESFEKVEADAGGAS
ncbi:MAG: BatD family protein, partial [Deltaproteobacteria bacterium]|nr:BatD family protein [Deltaproteobacteria bacterium]